VALRCRNPLRHAFLVDVLQTRIEAAYISRRRLIVDVPLIDQWAARQSTSENPASVEFPHSDGTDHAIRDGI